MLVDEIASLSHKTSSCCFPQSITIALFSFLHSEDEDLSPTMIPTTEPTASPTASNNNSNNDNSISGFAIAGVVVVGLSLLGIAVGLGLQYYRKKKMAAKSTPLLQNYFFYDLVDEDDREVL